MILYMYTDPCFSKQCGQICVNTPSGPTCICYEGYDLTEDERSCRGIPNVAYEIHMFRYINYFLLL